MLFCFLLTDKEAKRFTNRKVDALIESWLCKKENLNAKDLFFKRKTPCVNTHQETRIYIIEVD